MNHQWTPIDRLLRWFRLRKIEKYIQNDSLLCDLGCGQDAFLLKYFAPRIRHGFGFDMLIKNFTIGNIVVKGAILNDWIPLDSESIDVVTVLAALEHFYAERNILSEARRVLKRGGLLLITVPTYYNRPLLEFLSRVRFINRAEIIDHKRYYSKRDIHRVLFEAGFKPQDIYVHYWQFGLNLFAKATK